MKIVYKKIIPFAAAVRFSLLILQLTVSCMAFGQSRLDGQSAVGPSQPWVIAKDRWSDVDERNYSGFIQALGSSGCNTVDKCLKSRANPYRASDPVGAFFDADCGKFPYLLRGYFAWKNSLPFSFANGIVSADGPGGDLRYSPNGNVVTSRQSVLPSDEMPLIDGYRMLKAMQGNVDTAMYRVHPARDDVFGAQFSDFYMAKVDRADIRPGSMIYDPAGHVVIVYMVEVDGRVRYFDAHPDRTVSHGVYGEKFERSRPGTGAGFKNFRSLRLVGSHQSPNGYWYGGTVTTDPMESTAGFSLEQFFGTERRPPYRDRDWKAARFVFGGRDLPWYDFVRARMAIGELKYHPLEEMQNAMQSLCGDIQDRETAVQTAVSAGIPRKPHPLLLPNNIYGTMGEWEEFASPSRDARLKTSFKELRDRVEQMVMLFRQGDPRVVYTGTDLPGDLRRSYDQAASACPLAYHRSDGQEVSLTYDQVATRLFAMSFDPYACVERRWGATEAQELMGCHDTTVKEAWYEAEERLRNQIARPYDAKMSFSLADLQNKVPDSGVDSAPDVDLRTYLKNLGP